MTIEQARKSTYPLINNIAQGINPKEEKTELDRNIFFQMIFDKYIEKHAKLHNRTWEHDIY